MLQPLKDKLTVYKVPLLLPIIIKNDNSLYFIDLINNNNIINIYSYKYIKELLKRVINILLKYTRTVFYTK